MKLLILLLLTTLTSFAPAEQTETDYLIEMMQENRAIHQSAVDRYWSVSYEVSIIQQIDLVIDFLSTNNTEHLDTISQFLTDAHQSHFDALLWLGDNPLYAVWMGDADWQRKWIWVYADILRKTSSYKCHSHP